MSISISISSISISIKINSGSYPLHHLLLHWYVHYMMFLRLKPFHCFSLDQMTSSVHLVLSHACTANVDHHIHGLQAFSKEHMPS